MNKIIMVSNRLPVTIDKQNNEFTYKESIGGLATGLKSIHKESRSLWLGWVGIPSEQITKPEKKYLTEILKKDYKSIPVFLSEEEIEEFYYGFCNNTIWPLFHYFNNHTVYKHVLWESYKEINDRFFKEIESVLEENDTIWIHDYQLMLLPKLVKEKYPNTSIGFFLHIPFPSYELFRNLPWREEILEGMLGADLIGFHTYDYVRHFTSSVRRILRMEHNLGYINVHNRQVLADVFPMGIDYKKYSGSHDNKIIQAETNSIVEKTRGLQVILSVDRLDYTKGIPERIKAFNLFLKENPEYKEKVTLILIIAPSRTKVDAYIDLRKEVEELISRTNGEHGTIGWVPVWFFYRSFNFEELTAIYGISDVLLVTPLRDGMNLIAKEYIATHIDKKGIVVLSETAGAASELSESIIINPNNIKQVSDGIKQALEMPVREQIDRNNHQHERLKHYDINFWAKDFLNKLELIKEKQEKISSWKLTEKVKQKLISDYKQSNKRLLLLDYDGTLRGFEDKPEKAYPDQALIELLKKLKNEKGNELVIISGRDRNTLNEWFSELNISIIAAHGMWRKLKKGKWEITENVSNDWKKVIKPVLEVHTRRTPGSFIEEKNYSLCWHYRKCDPDLAQIRLSELKDALINLTNNLSIGFLNGNKVLEVKNLSINKGSGASFWLNKNKWDFILCIGDDWTDEDMFRILPENAYSIKVGFDISEAKYRLRSVKEVKALLNTIANL